MLPLWLMGVLAVSVYSQFQFEAIFVGALIIFGAPYLIWWFFLLMLWPTIAICVKRFHDRNKSGWWALIMLIPYIGFLWVIIECGLLPGTSGLNKFGPESK